MASKHDSNDATPRPSIPTFQVSSVQWTLTPTPRRPKALPAPPAEAPEVEMHGYSSEGQASVASSSHISIRSESTPVFSYRQKGKHVKKRTRPSSSKTDTDALVKELKKPEGEAGRNYSQAREILYGPTEP